MLRGCLLTPAVNGWLFAAALVGGSFKALFVLDRAARKNIARITSRQDGACLGGVYSWKMWGLVVCMMLGGRLLRDSGVPTVLITVLYVAVGWALLLSSRLLWRARFSLAEKIA
ncbi:hypothetical protein ACUUL3_10605 [Thiovibrio sp. JS02]